MNVVIFGATGATGHHLVKEAVAQGYNVAALVRDPARLTFGADRMTVIPGDVMDAAAVERSLHGQSAVLCALGSGTKRTGVRADGTRTIVNAMRKQGVRRLICLSTLGIRDSRPLLSPLLRYVIVPLILRDAFADHERQEQIVEESDLDWTIVRAGSLTDGPRTGQYRHGFEMTDRSVKVKISRADAADFMLKQLSDQTYIGKVVGVSY